MDNVINSPARCQAVVISIIRRKYRIFANPYKNKAFLEMTKYREFKGLNLPDIDNEILAFWTDNQIFEKSISSRPEDKTFVFYEGPPSA
ncbi:MAG TPA: hypothetical protein PK037_08285, partial [Saprospiraceae bacterium]|nr:hypothetical protein [Saprospiraceae bacterium]